LIQPPSNLGSLETELSAIIVSLETQIHLQKPLNKKISENPQKHSKKTPKHFGQPRDGVNLH
jgi:hypothetical protein